MVYMHEVDTLVFKFCIKECELSLNALCLLNPHGKLVCFCGVGIKKPCVIIVEVI